VVDVCPDVFGIFSLADAFLSAQQFDPSLYQELHWRMIGPFRAGRTGSHLRNSEPANVFYMAPNNGGVLENNRRRRDLKPDF